MIRQHLPDDAVRVKDQTRLGGALAPYLSLAILRETKTMKSKRYEACA